MLLVSSLLSAYTSGSITSSKRVTLVTLQEKSSKLESKHFHGRAEKMGSKEERFNLRRSFIQLFVGAETGLGIKNNRVQRDHSLQSTFRSELILKTGSEHPISDYNQLWCLIHRNYK